jgi:hypothetical protein
LLSALGGLRGHEVICGEKRCNFRVQLAAPRLDSLATFAPSRPAADVREAHALRAIRLARTCYDHLAGALGVAIADALTTNGLLVLGDRAYRITDAGVDHLSTIGLQVNDIIELARRTRRPLARACLDWSERRHHLAGALGAALCSRLLELQWVERRPSTRALHHQCRST